MAKIFNGSIPIEQVFKFNQNAPLDDRVSVQYYSDLTGIKAYPGLMVYVSSEDKYYYYNSDNQWKPSSASGGGDGLSDGTYLGTINGQSFSYKGNITIPVGGSLKVNVRYSTNGGLTINQNNEGDYVGFHLSNSDTPSEDPNDYKPWHRLTAGVNVVSINEVYQLGGSNPPLPPILGSGNKTISDFNGWSENSLEPTLEKQYLWGLTVIQYSNDVIELSNPRILAVRGSEFLTGDLDNEMDYIALGSDGRTLKTERRNTELSIYFGSTKVQLSNLEVTPDVSDVLVYKILDNNVYTGLVQFEFPENTLLEDKLNFTISGTTDLGTVSKVFTIATVREGSGAIIYQLVPEVNVIKVNSVGNYITLSFKVGINKISGTTVEAVTSGAFMFYKKDDGNWTGFTTSTNLPASTATLLIKLKLLGENDPNSQIIYDVETIPVVKDGTNGTSITIVGSGTLPPASGYQEGDAWVDNNGHIWVIVNGEWVDCGQFKGDSGQSQYFHLKYSNDGGTTFTAKSDPNDDSTFGETEGTYMGYYVDNNPVDSNRPQDYTWHKISGDDGPGSEWVYYLMSGNDANTPSLVDESNKPEYQQDDFIPKDLDGISWTDNPTGVDENHRTEFCAQRKKRNGVWEAFGNAVLWSRFSKDGNSPILYDILLSHDYITSENKPEGGIRYFIQRIIGETQNNLDYPDVTAAGLTLTYSIDDAAEVTVRNDFDPISATNIEKYITFYLKQGNNLIATKSCNVLQEGGIGIGVGAIEEYYKRTSTTTAPVFPGRWNGNDSISGWSKSIIQVTSDEKYLWNVEVSIGTDGNVIGVTDPALIATYSKDGRGLNSIIEYYLTTTTTNYPARWTGDSGDWHKTDTEKTLLSAWSNTPVATTKEKPYLWNFAKMTFSLSSIYEYEVPQLVGNHASSPLILDLTNEMDSIAVDKNGALAASKSLKTGVNMFYGTTPLTITSVTFNPTWGTFNSSTKEATITVPAGTYTDNIEVTITGVCSEGTCSKVFTISLAKPGEDGKPATIYQIKPSVNSIKVDSSLSYSPEIITVSVLKTQGDSTTTITRTTSDSTGPFLYRKIDSGNWGRIGTSTLIATGNANKLIELKLVSEKSGDSTKIYDLETIPVIFDGKDPLIADLDNEMVAFSVPAEGDLMGNPSSEFNYKIFLLNEPLVITNYNVATAGNEEGRVSVTHSKSSDSKNVNVKVTLHSGESYVEQDPLTVTVTGTCASGTVSKVFSVAFIKDGVNGQPATFYELLPSTSVVKKNSLGAFTDTLTVLIKKVIGETTSIVNQVKNLTIYYTFNSNNTGWTAITNSSTNILSLSGASNATKIYLKLVNSSNVIIDTESIPIVSDGLGGVTYSLKTSQPSFSHFNSVPLVIYSRKSTGEDESPYPAFFLTKEYYHNGEVSYESSPSSTNSNQKVSQFEWSPDSEDIYYAEFFAFDTTNFNSDLPVSQCTVLMAPPTVTLDLSSFGCSYSVNSSGAVYQDQSITINAVFRVNSSPEDPDAVSGKFFLVTPEKSGGYTTGMIFDQSASDDHNGILVFKATASSQAVDPPIQNYTITAKKTIGGITYTEAKTVSFNTTASGLTVLGANGCIIRFRGYWKDIVGFLASSGVTGDKATKDAHFDFNSNGTLTSPLFRYIDVVKHNNNYYRCVLAHDVTANSTFRQYADIGGNAKIPGGSTSNNNWEIAEEFDFIYTDSLIANYISSTAIASNDVTVLSLNEEGESTGIVAGMSSGLAGLLELIDSEGNTQLTPSKERIGDVRIWAGTSGWSPNILNAPFRVTLGGHLVATNAEILGSVDATQFRLILGGVEKLYLSTYGELKSNPNFMSDSEFLELGLNDGLPMFAAKDSANEWYYIPLTKIENRSVTTTYTPKYGYNLVSSLNATSIISSNGTFKEANSSNSNATTLYYCVSDNSNLNKRYFASSSGGNWSGYFTNPTYSYMSDDYTVTLQGNSCLIKIWSLKCYYIQNSIVTEEGYIFLGPSFNYSGLTLTANYSSPRFWYPVINGNYPTSSEISSTWPGDSFIGSSPTIVIGGNSSSGSSKPGSPTPLIV